MLNFNDKFTNSQLGELRRSEEEKLVQALAPQYGFEYINLNGYTINPEAIGLYPEKKARAAKIVVFDVKHDLLSVAAQTPNNPATVQALQELQNNRQNIQLFMCSQASLEHAWKRYVDIVKSTAEKNGVFDISAEEITKFSKSIKERGDVAKFFGQINTLNNSKRVTETLELILAGALGLRASDIHIEPEKTTVRLRYRLDGVLQDIFDIDRYIYDRLISRLKLISGMTLNQKMESQDGRFTFTLGEQEIDVRSSIIPGAAGESMVMRLLDSGVASYTLDKIEMNQRLREVMEKELKKPNGLILTTGPTGSGKTTVLYAFLRAAHKEGVKIITIENPVEYKIEGIVQTQISDNYSFASGLRAILRQDPDIILVGEIRDQEVAETALHAAQTGHLVFSTLHANNAAAAFSRLIDLGVDSRVLGTSVNAVLGQRLVRRLCDKCKVAYTASDEELSLVKEVLKSHPDAMTVSEPLTLYKAVGCNICGNTGYKGRVGIFEAILMDEAVEETVINDPREHVLFAAAKAQGIPTMLEDGMEKVASGVTSIVELERMIEIPRLKPNVPDAGDDSDAFLSHVVT